MATFRKPIQISALDATVFPDRIANQLSLTNATIGNQVAIVLNDGGSDEGVHCRFSVPKNYVGTPVLVIKGILDGAPGASETLGFGCTGLARADNESADAAYGSEDAASATIGSSGTNHADEDAYEETITLTNLGTLAVDDEVFLYVYLDASGTTYGGNFLLTSLLFQYADA